MTQVLWRTATDAASYPADDLTRAGAEVTGGRWNAKGHAVLYTSMTRSLACLETVVHLNASGLPLNRYLVEITVPDPVWAAAQTESAASLPIGWDAEPASFTSINFGTNWITGNVTALLVLPSVIVPEEFNVLINPAHADMAGIAARKMRRWLYDPRLLRR